MRPWAGHRLLAGQDRPQGFDLIDDEIEEGGNAWRAPQLGRREDAPAAGQLGNRAEHPHQIGLGVAESLATVLAGGAWREVVAGGAVLLWLFVRGRTLLADA